MKRLILGFLAILGILAVATPALAASCSATVTLDPTVWDPKTAGYWILQLYVAQPDGQGGYTQSAQLSSVTNTNIASGGAELTTGTIQSCTDTMFLMVKAQEQLGPTVTKAPDTGASVYYSYCFIKYGEDYSSLNLTLKDAGSTGGADADFYYNSSTPQTCTLTGNEGPSSKR